MINHILLGVSHAMLCGVIIAKSFLNNDYHGKKWIHLSKTLYFSLLNGKKAKCVHYYLPRVFWHIRSMVLSSRQQICLKLKDKKLLIAMIKIVLTTK